MEGEMQTVLAKAGQAPAWGRRPAEVLVFAARPGAASDPAGQALLGLVATALGVPEAVLLHQQRCRRPIARARQLAMYLMHVILQRDYAEVGRFFQRDRTTVSYACALIEDLREDKRFDAEVCRLEAVLETLRTGDGVAR
jgi:hypothetical protein